MFILWEFHTGIQCISFTFNPTPAPLPPGCPHVSLLMPVITFFYKPLSSIGSSHVCVPVGAIPVEHDQPTRNHTLEDNWLLHPQQPSTVIIVSALTGVHVSHAKMSFVLILCQSCWGSNVCYEVESTAVLTYLENKTKQNCFAPVFPDRWLVQSWCLLVHDSLSLVGRGVTQMSHSWTSSPQTLIFSVLTSWKALYQPPSSILCTEAA